MEQTAIHVRPENHTYTKWLTYLSMLKHGAQHYNVVTLEQGVRGVLKDDKSILFNLV